MKRESSRAKSGAKGLNEAVRRHLDAARQRDRQAREIPANDETIQVIWTAWKILPESLSADERRDLLAGISGAQVEFPDEYRKLRSHPGFPFGGSSAQSLHAVWTWARAVEEIRNAWEDRERLVDAFWGFGQADNISTGRLALWRAAEELKWSDSGFDPESRPTLIQIQNLLSRRDRYEWARGEAQRRLFAGLLGSHRDKAPFGNPPGGSFGWAAGISPGQELDLLARLEALQICFERRLRKFFSERLPALSPEERQRFYQLATRPRIGKDRLLPFQVWLADNIPVIEAFHLRPQDLLDAARDRGIPCCATASQLTKLRSDWNLPFRFGQGIPPRELSEMWTMAVDLLSPKPVFVSDSDDSED